MTSGARGRLPARFSVLAERGLQRGRAGALSLRRRSPPTPQRPSNCSADPKEWYTGAADRPFDIATFRRRHLSAFTAAGD